MSITNVDLSNVDFSQSNVLFVDGLTLEMVKIKYAWLFNAKIKDAIIGEDQNGLVWYFGDWICGEWVNGTWYSGTFHDGHWLNGQWYSYLLNKFDVLSQNFNILETDNKLSVFKNGVWESGTFNSGTFGENIEEFDWSNYQLDSGREPYRNAIIPVFKQVLGYAGGSSQHETIKLATWMNGYFNNGIIANSIWNDGSFNNGYIKNSQWINGKFFNGKFDGDSWYNGKFYNGEFIRGKWLNGTFTKFNSNLVSYFGNTNLTGATICEWMNGEWMNGEFFSGYIKDISGNTLPSIQNNITIWYDGVWYNGIWWGGHFKKGIWNNGIWNNGIFGDIGQSEWISPTTVGQYDLTNWKVISGNTAVIETVDTINTFTTITGGTYDSTDVVFTTLKYDDITQSLKLYNNNNNISYVYTDNIEYQKGNGTNNTYWEFSRISLNELIADNNINININDTIYIESAVYTGYLKIINIYTDTETHFKTDIQLPNSDTPGRAYVLDNLKDLNIEKITNTISFKEFDYGDISSDLILGYMVRYKKVINSIGVSPSGYYKDNYISLNVNNIVDYNPDYFQDFLSNQHREYNINILKENMRIVSATTITTDAVLSGLTFEEQLTNVATTNYLNMTNNWQLTDDVKKDVQIGIRKLDNILLDVNPNFTYYGSINNYWSLDSLLDYYADTGGTRMIDSYTDNTPTTFVNKVNFENNSTMKNSIIKILGTDVKKLDALNNISINMNFKYYRTNNIRLNINEVGLKFYYLKSDKPIWNNGYFKRGTWLNGDFNNGTFDCGIWMYGNFNNGVMGAQR